MIKKKIQRAYISSNIRKVYYRKLLKDYKKYLELARDLQE